MQVLQDQHQRRPGGETGQQPEHSHEQAVPGREHVVRTIIRQQPFRLMTQRGDEWPVGQCRPGHRRRLAHLHPRPVSSGPYPAGQLFHQPRLADAGLTGDQHHLRLARHRPGIGGRHDLDLRGPSYDGRQRRRWRGVLRGRLRGGLGDRELEETNRPVEVLQPALAEFHQREGEFFLLLVLDEGLRRLGDEDLAAAGGGADPGRAMDGQARIGSLDRDRLARVNAHPDPDGRAGRPFVAGQRPPHLQRAQDGLLGARERHEEGIALGVNLVAGLTGDGRADQAPVIGQNLRVALPQRLHQAGRALDVAEQEGDCPARKFGHRMARTRTWAVDVASRSTARLVRGTPPT